MLKSGGKYPYLSCEHLTSNNNININKPRAVGLRSVLLRRKQYIGALNAALGSKCTAWYFLYGLKPYE